MVCGQLARQGCEVLGETALVGSPALCVDPVLRVARPEPLSTSALQAASLQNLSDNWTGSHHAPSAEVHHSE